jgi:leucyl-tRNA synthetase
VIRDVTIHIENFEFNIAIARIREFTNFLEKFKANTEEEKQSYFFAAVVAIRLFSPFAPHLCSELLENIGFNDYSWPKYDENVLRDNCVTMAIQLNGKLRSTIKIQKNLDENEIKILSTNDPKIRKYLNGRTIKRMVVIPDRVINIVL